MVTTFKNDEEILDLVRRFESCQIPPAEFRHYQHLTVALWYVRQFPYDVASEKMRAGIQKLAAAYGKSGYHETITLFWLIMVRDFVARADENEATCDLANRLVTSYGNKELIKKYYSEELLSSAEAKEAWREPDLKSLPDQKLLNSISGGTCTASGQIRALNDSKYYDGRLDPAPESDF